MPPVSEQDGHNSRDCNPGSRQYASPPRLLAHRNVPAAFSPMRRLLNGATHTIRILREVLHSIIGLIRPLDAIPPSHELDEYGFPQTWRRDPVTDVSHERMLRRSDKHWPTFERWCQQQGLRAFPASEETLLRFLLFPPVVGRQLYDIWWAVSCRHDAYYWMEDADPVYLIKHGHGVSVSHDGRVTIPDEIQLCGGMSSQLLSELNRFRRMHTPAESDNS